MKTVDITYQDNTLKVSGTLSFSNVMSVYEKSLPYLTEQSKWIFDFSAVVSSDSAGLALMFEWIKLANIRQQSFQFLHVSQDLLSLAKAAGLLPLLS